VGFSQPLYDIGKLLHWAEPVGWAQAQPGRCLVEWNSPRGGAGWRIDARTKGVSAAAERRREFAEAQVRQFAEAQRATYGSDFDSMLAIATASAHAGLAAALKGDEKRTARRFAFAHALKHLAMLS